MKIHSNFVGGNGVINKITEENYFVEPELRDTTQNWFYWCFKIEDCPDSNLTFTFNDNNLTANGYAFSLDDGITWEWANAKLTDSNKIIVPPIAVDKEMLISMAMPYTTKNWHYFINNKIYKKYLKKELLAITNKGTKNYLYRFILNSTTKQKIIITARHHCCEMMASYVVEGMIKFICENVSQYALQDTEVCFIPFVDIDGTDAGDQGKARAPHDHNRDYGEINIYPEIKAIQAEVINSKNQKTITLDLHCPWIKGNWNELIYLVGSPYPHIQEEEKKFLKLLEKNNKSPLPITVNHILPYGESWNTVTPGSSNYTWCGKFPHIKIAASMEIPYAIADGIEVNQISAREFGKSLMNALLIYI